MTLKALMPAAAYSARLALLCMSALGLSMPRVKPSLFVSAADNGAHKVAVAHSIGELPEQHDVHRLGRAVAVSFGVEGVAARARRPGTAYGPGTRDRFRREEEIGTSFDGAVQLARLGVAAGGVDQHKAARARRVV